MAANQSTQFYIDTKAGRVKVYAKRVNDTIEFTLQRKRGLRPVPVNVRAMYTESKLRGKIKHTLTLISSCKAIAQSEFNQLKEIAADMLANDYNKTNQLWNALINGDYKGLLS